METVNYMPSHWRKEKDTVKHYFSLAILISIGILGLAFYIWHQQNRAIAQELKVEPNIQTMQVLNQ
jgi:hypothetical protein